MGWKDGLKSWEDKRDWGCIPDTFMYNKNNTGVDPLTLQQLNPDSPAPYIYMGWGKSGFNCWGVSGHTLVLFLFYMNVFWMFLQSHLSLSLWHTWLPMLSTMTGGLFLWFPPRWLPPIFLMEYGGWVKTYYFLFTSTLTCFPVFPLLLTPSDLVPWVLPAGVTP